jgi:hypothetical protein
MVPLEALGAKLSMPLLLLHMKNVKAVMYISVQFAIDPMKK